VRARRYSQGPPGPRVFRGVARRRSSFARSCGGCPVARRSWPGGVMQEKIWAIRCKECGAWFFLCRRCYRGQRYCSGECRKEARRRQCRAAQVKYRAKLQGKKKCAAAAKAYRRRPPNINSQSSDNRHRSSFCQSALAMVEKLPKVAFCGCCRCFGPVVKMP
jgi:hypothetical protein